MKKTALALAVAASITGVGNVSAATIDERMIKMEKRLQYLEQRIASQDKVIAEKDKQISALTGGEESGSSWFSRVEVGGVVEVEASRSKTDGSSAEEDVITPTVELGIAAQVNDWVSGEIVLLYEEDTDNDDGSGDGSDLSVDTAMVTIADPDANWFINAGQYVVPFGTYGTNMVSDPVTLDMGETGDTALEAGFGANGLAASVYVFEGDVENKDISSWGAALLYETETQNFAFSGHLGYISDIIESDGVGEVATASGEAPAWSASAEITSGPFTVIGEYLVATDAVFAASTDEPSAFNLEVGYGFEAGGIPAIFALGYQGSDEADGLLPEEKILAALSFEIMDGTTIAAEVSNEEDYAGVETDTVTGLLAVEF